MKPKAPAEQPTVTITVTGDPSKANWAPFFAELWRICQQYNLLPEMESPPAASK